MLALGSLSFVMFVMFKGMIKKDFQHNGDSLRAIRKFDGRGALV